MPINIPHGNCEVRLTRINTQNALSMHSFVMVYGGFAVHLRNHSHVCSFSHIPVSSFGMDVPGQNINVK